MSVTNRIWVMSFLCIFKLGMEDISYLIKFIKITTILCSENINKAN